MIAMTKTRKQSFKHRTNWTWRAESRKTGRIKCSVDYSQSLVHSFDSKVLDSLSTSLSSKVNSAFSHKIVSSSPTSAPHLANAKHWTIYIDLLVNSLSGGNTLRCGVRCDIRRILRHTCACDPRVAFEAPATLDESGHAVQVSFPPTLRRPRSDGHQRFAQEEARGAAAGTPRTGSSSNSKCGRL